MKKNEQIKLNMFKVIFQGGKELAREIFKKDSPTNIPNAEYLLENSQKDVDAVKKDSSNRIYTLQVWEKSDVKES